MVRLSPRNGGLSILLTGSLASGCIRRISWGVPIFSSDINAPSKIDMISFGSSQTRECPKSEGRGGDGMEF